MYWYEKTKSEITSVLSTRVRFARNLENLPFPAGQTEEEKEKVFQTVKEAFSEKNMMAVPFGGLDPLVKEAYVQTRLASPALGKQGKGAGLLLSRDGEVSVMVGEEDHIRLQVITAGKDIFGTTEKAVEWMKYGEERLPVAYREKFGYLTACPTNLGAAMRLSVMIHLPCLGMIGGIGQITESLGKAGVTVRGLFGEGSRGKGNIYQISNQNGRISDPMEIARQFSTVLEKVEEKEKEAGEILFRRDRIGLEDRIFRSLGILKYAKKMSYGEFIDHFSLLRLGQEMGMEELVKIKGLDRLFVELQAAPMILLNASLSEETERDTERSRRLQKALWE